MLPNRLGCKSGTVTFGSYDGGLTIAKPSHLGVPESPKLSTLAYTSRHRPLELYQSVLHSGYQRCRQEAGKGRRFRVRHGRVILDATVIDTDLGHILD